jgi:hypothetical protein
VAVVALSSHTANVDNAGKNIQRLHSALTKYVGQS